MLPAQLRARRGGAIIELGLRDVKILRLLYERRGQVVDRDMFFNVCWGLDYAPNSCTPEQRVSKPRKRIKRDPKSPRIIRAAHRTGYRYEG